MVLDERHRLHCFRSVGWSIGKHRKSNRYTAGRWYRHLYDRVRQFSRQLTSDVKYPNCNGTSPSGADINSRLEYHRQRRFHHDHVVFFKRFKLHRLGKLVGRLADQRLSDGESGGSRNGHIYACLRECCWVIAVNLCNSFRYRGAWFGRRRRRRSARTLDIARSSRTQHGTRAAFATRVCSAREYGLSIAAGVGAHAHRGIVAEDS